MAAVASPSATSAAAARLLLPLGLLLPSLIAVGLSWLGVLYSKLGPIRSWMVAALPGLVQLADEQHAKPTVELETVQSFCGTWIKDAKRSDPMDGFCQLFGVPRWLRQATRLMAGLEVTLSGDMLVVKQVCKLSWLSTTEAFPVDGLRTAPQRRRDMRSGKQLGQLVSASGDVMQLRVVWQGSLPGQATDTLQLVPQRGKQQPEELLVLHEAQVDGKGSARFQEVYVRR